MLLIDDVALLVRVVVAVGPVDPAAVAPLVPVDGVDVDVVDVGEKEGQRQISTDRRLCLFRVLICE